MDNAQTAAMLHLQFLVLLATLVTNLRTTWGQADRITCQKLYYNQVRDVHESTEGNILDNNTPITPP